MVYGLKFFDKLGNLLMSCGTCEGNRIKEISLDDNERIVGVKLRCKHNNSY
jgi:hypothetical protein